MGLRIAREEVFAEISRTARERGGQRHVTLDGEGPGGTRGADCGGCGFVDLDSAFEICARISTKRKRRDPDAELRETFWLFTETDHIALEDLRRVAKRLGGGRLMGDEQLLSMIDEFDRDLDGRISFKEFRRIFEPPTHDRD